MLNSKESIRLILLYEYKRGHNATVATQNLCQAIGPNVINIATAYRWFERFREGDESLKDDHRSGRPPNIDLSELKEAIESDPSLSVRDVASKLECSISNTYYHIKQLGYVSKRQWLVTPRPNTRIN